MFGVFLIAAASFLTSPVEQIVLHNGAVIEVDELVRVERGRLIYANADGTLYSVRLVDVDVEETDRRLPANQPEEPVEPRTPVVEETDPRRPGKLPVSEEEKKRILAEMERRSHTGRARPVTPSTQSDPPDMEMDVEGESDEWKWREASRRHHDAVAMAKERLAAAKQRERELNDLLLFFAGGTGDANNYSYLVYQLADLRSMIPQLEADVGRAQDALQQFLSDARRQGILPGWLR